MNKFLLSGVLMLIGIQSQAAVYKLNSSNSLLTYELAAVTDFNGYAMKCDLDIRVRNESHEDTQLRSIFINMNQETRGFELGYTEGFSLRRDTDYIFMVADKPYTESYLKKQGANSLDPTTAISVLGYEFTNVDSTRVNAEDLNIDFISERLVPDSGEKLTYNMKLRTERKPEGIFLTLAVEETSKVRKNDLFFVCSFNQ